MLVCWKRVSSRPAVQKLQAAAVGRESMTTLTAINGRKYQLDALVNRVEYGEETLAEMTNRLGADVAAEVGKQVTARESQFSGRFVKETAQAWLFRCDNG